jgi:nitroreductase / dihydropteridine reductase
MKNKSLIDSLEWRYACKKFDSAKTLSNEKVETLLNALNLTPTSMGMQLMHFIVIENKEIQKQLVPFAFNQQQVEDCSHLLVLCRELDVKDSFIDALVDRTVSLRNFEDNKVKIEGLRKMLKITQEMKPIDRDHWIINQVYIALGVLMTACAIEEVDACPMEGFQSTEFDRILGLKDKGLTSVLLCPIGYRHEDDSYSSSPKVRQPIESIVTYI